MIMLNGDGNAFDGAAVAFFSFLWKLSTQHCQKFPCSH